ncbi:hypothetical protein Efla_005088 [Eimeria flavescens]
MHAATAQTPQVAALTAEVPTGARRRGAVEEAADECKKKNQKYIVKQATRSSLQRHQQQQHQLVDRGLVEAAASQPVTSEDLDEHQWLPGAPRLGGPQR